MLKSQKKTANSYVTIITMHIVILPLASIDSTIRPGEGSISYVVI